MANESNLEKGKATQFRAGEEQAKIAQQGGAASGEARRRKRDLRMAIEAMLEKEYEQKDKNGNVIGKVTGTEAIAAKLFQQAWNGNIRAFEILRDTAGQKPVDKVEMKTDVNIEESTARLKSLFYGIANNDG